MTRSAGCEVYIIGSGTGIPYIRRASPAVLIKIENKRILLDAGMGTFQKLIMLEVTYQDIDYILFSHLHPDHTLDLVSFLFAARNPRDLRTHDINIIGPKGLKSFYKKLLALYSSTIKPAAYKVNISEVSKGLIEFGSWNVLVKPLPHGDGSIGFRIQTKSGKVVTYSGDTDYCDNIIELSKDADVLILECSFPDEFKVQGHLTPSLAGKIAEKADSKKLILTHLYPICDSYPVLNQAKSSFKGEIIVAKDFLKLHI